MNVRVEQDGPIATVTIDRPHARNAVDRETAEALSKAFREIEADGSVLASVLYGDHGTFCDYDPEKDPISFGFPPDGTRHQTG